ncbi:11600_t:CDS:2 [Dentiscutata heterogama]|uniref:11600_t:CDS:1 n=1 Tax=Dentiscutata heterogama TaxID=1316150 RepID=A0ACA9JZL3_9GLOM|nr:11600_t:CDS:2 [Dentiscutata heterogama]
MKLLRYSLSKVCLSVQTYENGFQVCLEYINNFPNECPSLPTKIKEIITSWHHFFENKQFTTVFQYIVDANAKLESNNTTLEVPKKNLTKKLVEKDKDIDDLDDYYEELFSSDFTDKEDNELEFSHVQKISLESIQNNSESFMEEELNNETIEATRNNLKRRQKLVKRTFLAVWIDGARLVSEVDGKFIQSRAPPCNVRL